MKRDTVKSKDRLNKIIKTYRFYECCPVVVYLGFAAFGNLFAK